MNPVFLSAAASAATTVAALGYSLPDLFETVVLVFFSLLGFSFLFSSSRFFSRIFGFFKSDDNSDTKPE